VKIAVASGKGGTGKTTVAVSLALSLMDQHPIFLDCDVEEPNAALFFPAIFTEKRAVEQMIPRVDMDNCTLCERCAEVCQYHAITVIGQQVLVFPELCHGCGSCTLNCLVNAIQEIPENIGQLERGLVGQMTFAQGTLNIGQAMAVPVIRQLKKWMNFKESKNGPIILDTPPGASCPVVETLRGVDVVLLVTEPTPFGLHDLRAAVTVARDELKIPVAVIINRDGVGDSGVQLYCDEEHIPVVMRIPLEREIAEGIARGRPLIDIKPQYNAHFIHLWEELRRMAKHNYKVEI
jgi:MinD superfamily P-loop ATPase